MKRSRFLLGVLFGLLAVFGIGAYYAYATLYNQILEMSATTRVKADALNGADPLQLRITITSLNSAQDIRTVTTKMHGKSVIVRYHLALAGLVKPQLGWHEPYLLTVPDSVNEVRFGRGEQVIWVRETADHLLDTPLIRRSEWITGNSSPTRIS
jgi:hypothetical protein